MKNKKLNSLLNKVVEYNRPEEMYVKGFLYKDGEGKYYLKIVEIILGTLKFNQKHYLKEGDEEFITKAEKPKLMRVSFKSWHYRLVKYVLKGNAPTPKTMQNGCPYFWLLAFSMLVVPFKVVGVVIWEVLMLIPNGLNYVLEVLGNSWLDGLDDESAYDYYYYGNYDAKMPKTAKMHFKNKNYHTNTEIFEKYIMDKYNIKDVDDPKFLEKQEEIKAKWSIWTKKRNDVSNEKAKIRREKEHKRDLRRAEHDRKRAISKAKWDAKVDPIILAIDKFFTGIKNTFTVERGRINMIVKRTKQFFGLVVTLLVLGLTFLVVNFAARGITWFVDFSIGNWYIYAAIGALAVAAGIVYLLYVFVSSWLQGIINRYNKGKKLWYVEPFIYLIWYPLKYIVLAIGYLCMYILWIPIRFIFYSVIFNIILKPIGLFIAMIFVSLTKGLVSSSGIFGEYFGASYSDYCPGIEWSDFEEENV